MHAVLSMGFGVLFALVLPQLPPIPGPMAWGGLVLPLVWTGISYGLMGVVNPVLQERVDWPWFIVSQFVFGVVAAVVVLRSEMVHIPPAGSRTGPGGRTSVAGEGGGSVVSSRLPQAEDWRPVPAPRPWLLSWRPAATFPASPSPPTGRCRRTRSWISTPCTQRTAPAATGPTASSARRRR